MESMFDGLWALLVISVILLLPVFISWLASEGSREAPDSEYGEEDHPLPYKEPKKAHRNGGFSDRFDN